MFAIANSRRWSRFWKASSVLPCLLVGLGFATLSHGAAEPISDAKARWCGSAQHRLSAAQTRFANDPTNPITAWEYARATFERAEFSTNNAERAALAVHGIDACRQALARDDRLGPAYFYLGLNLGQLARTKLLSALKMVDEMERSLKTAASLDEGFNHAGPDRILGLLYYQAPVIGSVGSRAKARKHLERAAELDPGFPANRLNLAEAYLKWREKKPLQRELDALEKLWAAAQTTLAGPDWEPQWADWTKRIKNLRTLSEEFLKR